MITDEQTKEFVAFNVERLLREHSMTQVQLAAVTGEDKMRIWRIVNGLHMPSAAVVARIAEAFDVSPGELYRPIDVLTK